MSNKELLRCPFCGSEAKYGTNDGFHYIWCDDCGETIFGFSKKEAFDIWNTRVQCVDNEENCYYKNEENVVANGNYLEKQDSSKVNQSVQVPEVVANGNCKYLKLLDYIKFCRNASANDIRQIHDRARDLIAEHKECCEKSCKEENATFKPLVPKWVSHYSGGESLDVSISQYKKLRFRIYDTDGSSNFKYHCDCTVINFIADKDSCIFEEVGEFNTIEEAKAKANECIRKLGEMLVCFAENIRIEE